MMIVPVPQNPLNHRSASTRCRRAIYGSLHSKSTPGGYTYYPTSECYPLRQRGLEITAVVRAGAGDGASTRIDVWPICWAVGVEFNHIRLTLPETDATQGIVGGLGNGSVLTNKPVVTFRFSGRLPLSIELTSTLLSMRSYLQSSGFAKTVNCGWQKLRNSWKDRQVHIAPCDDRAAYFTKQELPNINPKTHDVLVSQLTSISNTDRNNHRNQWTIVTSISSSSRPVIPSKSSNPSI